MKVQIVLLFLMKCIDNNEMNYVVIDVWSTSVRYRFGQTVQQISEKKNMRLRTSSSGVKYLLAVYGVRNLAVPVWLDLK